MPESKNKPQESIIEPKSGQTSYPEFIEMAVHDLQAPLRKLGVLTDRLTNKYKSLAENDEEVLQYTSRISTCLTDMRILIDSLKEYGNTSFDKISPVPIEMEQLIRRALYESQAAFPEKKAIVTMTGFPVLEGDKAQYRQLFKRIFDNAFVFSKKDTELTIDIRSGQLSVEEKKKLDLPDEKNYYKIEIADNGIGFGQDNAAIIFGPFVRLNGKTYNGNGLGLAIVKRIVNNHRGIVYTESEENQGARFFLILPEKN